MVACRSNPRRAARRARLLSAAVLLGLQTAAVARDEADPLAPSGRFSVVATTAAPTPPMGWNPWNAFRTDVDEAKIRGSALALVSTGLAAKGYRYVNVDDGWALQRLADGRLRVRDSMFPSAAVPGSATGSMMPFTTFIHGLGLKAGLYSDIGANTCAQRWDAKSPNLPEGSIAERRVGSFGHADTDIKTIFADWNFDYIKVDACGVADYTADVDPVRSGAFQLFEPYIVRGNIPASNPPAVEALYAELETAIRRWGEPDAVLSICTWGEALAPRWANEHGNLWRTSPDIEFNWKSMLANVDSAVDLALYAGPGHWNDPDMLAIGHDIFDEHHLTEARAHMSLWAIMAAPLLLGYDLRQSPAALLDVVGNPEVIAIDQDPAGNQGIAYRDGDTLAVVRTLANPTARAVVLFNRSDRYQSARATWQQLGFRPGTTATVRDLWAREEQPPARDFVQASLKPHEAVLLRLAGTPIDPNATPLDEMPARIHVAADGLRGQALPAGWVPARVAAAPDGSPLRAGSRRGIRGIGLFGNSRLEVRAAGEFVRFTAVPVLLDTSGSVRFQVYADRQLVGDVTVSPGQSPTLTAPVRGARIVELVARASGGSSRPPMIAWAEAALHR